MSSIKKQSFQEEITPLKLKHTISDIPSNRFGFKSKDYYNNIDQIQECQTEYTSGNQFFNLIGYDCFLNEINQGKAILRGYNKQKELIQDRFIPNRKTSTFLYGLDSEIINNQNHQNFNNKTQNDANLSIADIYKKHVIGINTKNPQSANILQSFKNNNLLKFKQNLEKEDYPSLLKQSSFSLCEQLSSLSVQKHRKIAKMPVKVLDAPTLQDDFYLNLIDWSQQNLLAVGLGQCVYLWSAVTAQVTKLCDLGVTDSVTSISWTLRGPMLSIGTNSGQVQIWDSVKMKKLRSLEGHTSRIGAIAWNSNMFSSGSKDKTILHRDLRISNPFISKLIGHKQQICGLKWSPDQQQLCSGGNDNKLFIWNAHSCQPILNLNQHTAAVKAVAWSPHQHSLLASGGGAADKTIRFWNTLTGTCINKIDSGSQICNLMFSKTVNELVSTHGYSQNEINIWKYPKMEKISTLTGHTYRVLYLAMSPDGSTIVTGAGDETLRFWNVFPSREEKLKKKNSILINQNNCLR